MQQCIDLDEPFGTTIAEMEAQWDIVATASIAEVIVSNPTEDFYAAGFWLFYMDYSTVHPPSLSINTESYFNSNPYGAETRWDSANWQARLPMLRGTFENLPAYAQLIEQLPAGDYELWDRVDREHKLAIARLCRRLTARIRSGEPPFDRINVRPDFVVGIFEGRQSIEEYFWLVEASIQPQMIAELGIPLPNR